MFRHSLHGRLLLPKFRNLRIQRRLFGRADTQRGCQRIKIAALHKMIATRNHGGDTIEIQRFLAIANTRSQNAGVQGLLQRTRHQGIRALTGEQMRRRFLT